MNSQLAQLFEIFEDIPVSDIIQIFNEKANQDFELALNILLEYKSNNGKEVKDVVKKKRKVKGLNIKQFFIKKVKENKIEKEIEILENNEFNLNEIKNYKIESKEENFIQLKQTNKTLEEEVQLINQHIEVASKWQNFLKEKPKINELKVQPNTKLRLPVQYIYNEQLLKKHLPNLSLNKNFLDKELALKLFLELVEASQDWKPYDIYLFNQRVESPHLSTTFRDENHVIEIPYQRNGIDEPIPKIYSPLLKKAAKLVQNFVNKERIKRFEQFPEYINKLDLPINQLWEPNITVVNHYPNSQSSVGWHTDRLTYLGPRPIIASLSLGVTREFKLRRNFESVEKGLDKKIYSIELNHNDLLVMYPPTQEDFKHAILPMSKLTPFEYQNEDLEYQLLNNNDNNNNNNNNKIKTTTSRINLTFRYFQEEFSPLKTPKCLCGKHCDLRVITKDILNQGKYFYRCTVPDINDKKGCQYFQFINFNDNN